MCFFWAEDPRTTEQVAEPESLSIREFETYTWVLGAELECALVARNVCIILPSFSVSSRELKLSPQNRRLNIDGKRIVSYDHAYAKNRTL